MNDAPDIDRAIAHVNQILLDHQGKVLNEAQKLVVRGTLQGHSYKKIARLSKLRKYNDNHLKNIGNQLWLDLTKYWGVKVKKLCFGNIVYERLQTTPPRTHTAITPTSHIVVQREQWSYAFTPMWRNASQCYDWIPGYYEPADVEWSRQRIAACFANLKHFNMYEDVRHQWNEVRGFAHVYDWSELRQDTLSWLLERAMHHAQPKPEDIWHDRVELAWAKSVSGRPGSGEAAIEELRDLWAQLPTLAVSPLAQLELSIYLCATAIDLKRIDESDRWLQIATDLLDATPVRKSDRRWTRCEIDLRHYRAEALAEMQDWNESARAYNATIELARKRHCRRAVARAQWGLARVEIARSRPKPARACLNSGFERVSRHCDLRGQGFFAEAGASLASATGNRSEAVEWAARARGAFQQLGIVLSA